MLYKRSLLLLTLSSMFLLVCMPMWVAAQWPVVTGNSVFSSPVLGDLDNNDNLETIVASWDGKIYALAPDGSNLPGWPVNVGGTPNSSPALGDIDDDGELEVVIGISNSLRAYNTDGSQLWRAGTNGTVESSPAIGDLDDDGDLEVVVGDITGRVYAFNGADGSPVGAPWPFTTEGGITFCSPALGDLDGDGQLEIVIGSHDNNVYVLNADGTERWQQPAGDWVNSSPALGDIDGDGNLEIVVGSNDNNVYAFDRDGNALAGWPYATGGFVYSSPALADFDGDGDLEIVVGSYDNNVYVLDHEANKISNWPCDGFVQSSPAIGDIDCDGELEIVVGSWGAPVGAERHGKVYAFNLDGTQVDGWPMVTGNMVFSSPAVGDIDDDGNVEVVCGSHDGNIYCWEVPCDMMLAQLPQMDPMPWPMFRHDMHHTGRFGESALPNEMPDLIIEAVRLTADCYVEYNIRNIGYADAGESLTRLYVDSPQVPAVAEHVAGALAAGEGRWEQFDYVLGGGDHFVRVYADGPLEIDESNEENNFLDDNLTCDGEPECIDFEDPPLGTVYHVGDSFTDSGATITVEDFQWSNGTWTSTGFSEVENGGLAGGSGQEMEVNNVNLDFNFGTWGGLSLLFGEYGGNLNIKINGDFQNFENFTDIDGWTIGGVNVSVVNGLGNDQGNLNLSGMINEFVIGGQELYIDDVCPGAPEPLDCIDFEDPPLGTVYHVGDTFTDSGVSIDVKKFQWSNLQWTDTGYAQIEDGGLAGGTGQEAHTNNVNLDFHIGTWEGLSLLFGEYGGNINIEINGDFQNEANFADINGWTIGGVVVSVTDFGGGKESLELSGTISSFAIGGQELWIDHVCPGKGPEPMKVPVVLIPYVPDNDQPIWPSEDIFGQNFYNENYSAPVAAGNVIKYYISHVAHPSAIGVGAGLSDDDGAAYLGYFMDTNGEGMDRGNQVHDGTYTKDIKPGLSDFVRWDENNQIGDMDLPEGKKGYDWTVNTSYTDFDSYKEEIDCGRPMLVDFLYWNPIQTELPQIEYRVNDWHTEHISVYDLGNPISRSNQSNLSNGIMERWNSESGEGCLGHTVTGVGYIENYDPDGDGSMLEDNYAIVHDTWHGTEGNVAIPWREVNALTTIMPCAYECSTSIPGDVSGDGTVSAYDSALILQFVVGLIDVLPLPLPSPSSTGNLRSYDVSIPNLSVASGQRIEVPIIINDATGVSAGAFSLRYDAELLRPVMASATPILSGYYWDSNLNLGGRYMEQSTGEAMKGEVRIAFAGAKPASGKGTLFLIEFEALANTDGRTSPIIIDLAQLSESDITKNHGSVRILPSATSLLQNYPNPFNPETWLPYKLAQDARVDISIYDVHGALVRTLRLGDLSAGVYIAKEQAAFWNGKNDFGERVSSGVYFYTIRAGEFTATRRMVILK